MILRVIQEIQIQTNFQDQSCTFTFSFGHCFQSSIFATMMGSSNKPRSFAGINVKQDLGYGISTKSSKPPQPPNGELKQSQASRALTLAGYFVSGCMA